MFVSASDPFMEKPASVSVFDLSADPKQRTSCRLMCLYPFSSPLPSNL